MSLDLFDTPALKGAQALIKDFVSWWEQHGPDEVVNIEWFIHECKDFLEDPLRASWTAEGPAEAKPQPEQDPNLVGSLSVSGAPRQGEG